MTRLVRLVLRAALILISLIIAAALAEGALRVWYRDEGRRTLGGPGGRQFEHDTIDGELRGRRDIGPKRGGVPRIMVVGDSITYGQGVRDWRNTWPELLVRALESNGRAHELAVFAMPGDDMPQHLRKMREWAGRVRPDLLIYQWYVNDIEAISHRPDGARPWQRSDWHRALRGASYLYFVLDHRLSQMLPPPERSYVDYLLSDFAPGTLEWAEFERQFHEFAMRALQVATRRIMVMYPQVPFRGAYPLQPVHDRMRSLARAHQLAIPPAAWTRSGGTMKADPASPWKQVFEIPAKSSTAIIETAEYVFPSGPTPLELALITETAPAAEEVVATLQVLDTNNTAVTSTAVRVAGAVGTAMRSKVEIVIPGTGLRAVRLRLQSAGGPGWKLADIRVPVDYQFEVVDLTQPLNALPQTHASAFDAHPNQAAHRVMAEHIYAAITATAR